MNKTAETFDYNEAMKRVKEGKKVRRPLWGPDEYITIEECGIMFHTRFGSQRITLWRNDGEATDWSEYVPANPTGERDAMKEGMG